MPPLSHLISCMPPKPNWYLANALTAAVSEPALSRFLTFYVPNLMSDFHCLGCTRVSVQVSGKCLCFVTKQVFMVKSCQHLTQPPSWRSTPCWLSATAYSLYSQLHSTLEAILPSASWGCAMPWWQGSTYHGITLHTSLFYFSVSCPTPLCHIRFCVHMCGWVHVCVHVHACERYCLCWLFT